MGVLFAAIFMIIVWLAGVTVAFTAIASAVVWLTTFMTTPVFEDAGALLSTLLTALVWSVVAWVVGVVGAVATTLNS